MPLMRSTATPTALQMAWLQFPPCVFVHPAQQMLLMHYRLLASLGTQAAQEQWGVDPFDEKHRDTHSFAKRVGRLPEQQENDDVDYRGLLHRDGSVVSAVTLQVGCLRLPSSPPWAAWYNTWLLIKIVAERRSLFVSIPPPPPSPPPLPPCRNASDFSCMWRHLNIAPFVEKPQISPPCRNA